MYSLLCFVILIILMHIPIQICGEHFNINKYLAESTIVNTHSSFSHLIQVATNPHNCEHQHCTSQKGTQQQVASDVMVYLSLGVNDNINSGVRLEPVVPGGTRNTVQEHRHQRWRFKSFTVATQHGRRLQPLTAENVREDRANSTAVESPSLAEGRIPSAAAAAASSSGETERMGRSWAVAVEAEAEEE